MLCLGIEPGAAGLKAQTDPTSLKVNLSPTKWGRNPVVTQFLLTKSSVT